MAVDPEALDHLAARLENAASDLRDSGSSTPAVSLSGLGASALTALDHLATNAANLCEILEGAAAGVRETRDEYVVTDDAWAASLQSLGKRVGNR
ncbi:hypothetical protein [Sanguibacter suaedae]|uniref:hypothetical protein n=1 Tax=Sanguibacter suaedae TaxID=2795737 RepID=UPI0018E67EA0|nr:hypothetical protein [Sanguibacter suaedae]